MDTLKAFFLQCLIKVLIFVSRQNSLTLPIVASSGFSIVFQREVVEVVCPHIYDILRQWTHSFTIQSRFQMGCDSEYFVPISQCLFQHHLSHHPVRDPLHQVGFPLVLSLQGL